MEHLDMVYKTVDGQELCVDLFLPEQMDRPPLILWIHGGAWRKGTRKDVGLKRLVAKGYALASIDYRLSGTALFPAQITDCKSALVWLKKNAEKYGYNPARIAVAGSSAGGHLAALMGTSAGQADWEPAGTDCTVAAALDFFGPTCITSGWPDAAREDSPESCLLGAPVLSPMGRARAAAMSPITYVNGTQPPFLILHGTHDATVPYGQSVLLRNALEQAGSVVHMHAVPGAGHGFQSAAVDAVVDDFLAYYLPVNAEK